MFIQDIYINHAKPIPCHKKWIRGPQLNLICVCMFARFDYSLFCGCAYITWFLSFSDHMPFFFLCMEIYQVLKIIFTSKKFKFRKGTSLLVMPNI
jgi:hypothetical protein